MSDTFANELQANPMAYRPGLRSKTRGDPVLPGDYIRVFLSRATPSGGRLQLTRDVSP